ncbi:MAG: serine/threonine-protein kinase [Solirubrobacterales bacterium]
MAGGGPQPGDTFAGLVLEAEIGRGGMGVVFRARDVALGQPRAVKVIADEYSSDPTFVARFRREARLAASVQHPNLVPVLAAGEEAGRLYLVMRLVEGSNLATILEAGALDPDRAAHLLGDVAAGLDAAHAAGLVHRDVKPANVLVEPTAEGERAYLTDFGISKLVELEGDGETAATGLTRGGQVLGTADYVAPEQIEEGAADHRSDVYSFACVAFETLTGVAPFRRDTELSTLVAQTKAARPRASELNPSLPTTVDDPLAAGMAIDAAARPASAAALMEAVERGLRGGSPARTGDHRRWWISAVVAAVLIAVALAVLIPRSGDEDGGTSTGAGPPAPKPTVETGDVGAAPVGVAVGDLRVWVASRDSNQVDRLHLGAPKQADPPVPVESPRSVATGFGSIWVVNGKALYRLDPGEPGSTPVRIEAGDGPGDVAIDDRFVWVADELGGVTRVDPGTNTATGSVPAGDEPRSVATGGGAVWVVSSGDATLTKIDPDAVRVLGTRKTGVRPTSVAFGEGRVWVGDNAASKLIAVEPGPAGSGPGQVSAEADTAASPRGVAVGLGAVWVASGAEDLVERFDTGTLEPIGGPIAVGADPADIAVGEGAAYTPNFDDGTVSRIEP